MTAQEGGRVRGIETCRIRDQGCADDERGQRSVHRSEECDRDLSRMPAYRGHVDGIGMQRSMVVVTLATAAKLVQGRRKSLFELGYGSRQLHPWMPTTKASG
jgi:hypothetical protein